MTRQNKIRLDPHVVLFAADQLEAQDVLWQSLPDEVSITGRDGAVTILPPLVNPSRDCEVKLAHLFCGPCRSVVAAVVAYDVSASRPGAAPLLFARVQRVTDTATRPPTVRHYGLLLDDSDPGVLTRRGVHGAPVVDRIVSECAVHGLLEVRLAEARGRALQAWVQIRTAEASRATSMHMSRLGRAEPPLTSRPAEPGEPRERDRPAWEIIARATPRYAQVDDDAPTE